MGQTFSALTDPLKDWISAQQMFFVSTAPLAEDGLINCSPKGLDTFRVIDDQTVIYGDLNGSGIETAAHLQENGRIVIMFCAFAGPARILRLYGQGRYFKHGTAEFDRLADLIPGGPLRGIVSVSLTRIADSCGYGVPKYDYVGQRETLSKWVDGKSSEEILEYQQQKNRVSLDGLPGI